MTLRKTQLKKRRHARIRAKIEGTAEKPRLVVSRSLKHINVQLIDDKSGHTLLFVNDDNFKGTKIEKAIKVGEKIAELALAKKINTVVFDRGGYRYHGRIKSLAEAARSKGLNF